MRIKLFSIALLFLAVLFYVAGPSFKFPGSDPSPTVVGDIPAQGTQAPVVANEGSAPVLAPGVPVLMYHKVDEEKHNDAVISPERFREHMAYLYQQGYQPISLDELYLYVSQNTPLPPKPVVITFDDGYRDTYEIALPVLKQYGFKSVLFISAAGSGDRLSWQELREMKAAGMQVASHSYNHRELDSLSPSTQAEEISKAKELFDRMLNQDTRYFCYPNGSYNETTLRLLQAQGIVLAVTTSPGWAKPGDDPLTIRRIWMGNSVDLQHLRERLTREDYAII